MSLTPAVLRWSIVLACLGAACGGGSTSPPSATPTLPVTIQTEAGALTVIAYGCEPDLERFVREVNTSVRIARRQRPELFGGSPLTGFRVLARTPAGSSQRCSGNPACFERWGARGRLHVHCDGSGLEHESLHGLAWSVRLPCWESIGHDGVGFDCRRTR